MTNAPDGTDEAGASFMDRVRAIGRAATSAVGRARRVIRDWVDRGRSWFAGRGGSSPGSDLGPVTSGAYAALGDSFSSGEGARSYLPGTDTDTNRCHRSRNAYPMRVHQAYPFAGPLRFVACSGAKVRTLTLANPDGRGEPPQLDAVTDDTSLVTMTIGGNDLGFTEVLNSCARDPGSCRTTWDPILDERMAALQPELVAAYGAARESAPSARVVVLGYPRLFPTDPSPLDGMAWLFGVTNMRWMNGRADGLNVMLATAANSAGVEFVDPTAAFLGHAIGDPEPFLNDLDLFGPDGALIDSTSFHPNAAGQEAYAQALRRHLESTRAR